MPVITWRGGGGSELKYFMPSRITVEPLYKGQVPYSEASLQGTGPIQWSISTRDRS